MKEWLALGESKLGARGLLALLRGLASEDPGAVQRSIYWLEGLLLQQLGRKRFRSEVARLRSISADAAPKSGEHYTDEEILGLYVHVQEHPSPREKTVLDALAAEIGRSTGAITMVIRWIDGANFRSESSGRIKRQVDRAKALYA